MPGDLFHVTQTPVDRPDLIWGKRCVSRRDGERRAFRPAQGAPLSPANRPPCEPDPQALPSVSAECSNVVTTVPAARSTAPLRGFLRTLANGLLHSVNVVSVRQACAGGTLHVCLGRRLAAM